MRSGILHPVFPGSFNWVVYHNRIDSNFLHNNCLWMCINMYFINIWVITKVCSQRTKDKSVSLPWKIALNINRKITMSKAYKLCKNFFNDNHFIIGSPISLLHNFLSMIFLHVYSLEATTFILPVEIHLICCQVWRL